ncbi:MAG: hypothetical protein QG583_656 [Patescibacteria group bacterium]|nr:hypothetical protein [Patescibacteria group bacterium]
MLQQNVDFGLTWYNKDMKLKFIFILIVLGMIFSGYLSAIKLFTDTCAFNESCPYFLGYPACWYGFIMYFTMFVFTSIYLFGKLNIKSVLNINLVVSFAGIIFAGRFFIQELLQSKATGELGLSTCAYGLIFYILIFIFSFLTFRKEKNNINL